MAVAVAVLAVAAGEDAAGGAAVEVLVESQDDAWGEGDAGGRAAFAGGLVDAVAVVVAHLSGSWHADFAKLQVDDRAHAIVKAHEAGLIAD